MYKCRFHIRVYFISCCYLLFGNGKVSTFSIRIGTCCHFLLILYWEWEVQNHYIRLASHGSHILNKDNRLIWHGCLYKHYFFVLGHLQIKCEDEIPHITWMISSWEYVVAMYYPYTWTGLPWVHNGNVSLPGITKALRQVTVPSDTNILS